MSRSEPLMAKPVHFLRQHWPDAMVYVVTIILCLIAYFNIVLPTDTFGWDMSHHTLYGTLIARDLQTGNWADFWDHTHRQTLWPFLHSWLLGAYFVLFGISYVSARTFQLILFFILLLSTWHIGKTLDKGSRGQWIGAIGWGLLVFSYDSWFWGLEVMIDIVAGLITIFCFFALLQLERTRKWIWVFPTGILMGLILVTKYNYALHIYAAFAAWTLYRSLAIIFQPLPYPSKGKTSLINRLRSFKNELLAFGSKTFTISLFPLLTFFWWMFGPYSEKKWYMISFSKETWVDPQKAPGFFDQIIYYFKILVTMYTWMAVLGILTLVGLFGLLFLLRKRDPVKILLTIFIWTGMPILFWVFMPNDRYIYSLVPLIYLAAAVFWVSVWDTIKSKFGERRAKIVTGMASTALVLLIMIQSRPMLDYFCGKTYHKEPGERYMDVLNYIARVVPPNSVIACGSEANYISPYTFGFHFQHHIKNRTAPVFNKYSLPYVRFAQGMYLVAYMQDPTPEKIKEDQWYRFIEQNSTLLEPIDSKHFAKLNFRLDIYRIK